MKTRNIKLTIQYDGTAYHGWQLQPDMPTIEQAVTDAIEKLTDQKVKLHGSSRTDAGVHALGQVANFKIESPVPTENFARALNQILPDDICITEAVEVTDSFDAISNTKTKRYRYMIDTTPVRNPMQIRYCWHRPGKLDVEAMQSAAEFLKGKHDFKSFASAADQRQSSTRTITDISVARQGNTIIFEVEADGFLYNMVRNIVGTLVEVGRSRWSPDYIKQILDAKDRNAAGPIAPAGGLCLMKIDY